MSVLSKITSIYTYIADGTKPVNALTTGDITLSWEDPTAAEANEQLSAFGFLWQTGDAPVVSVALVGLNRFHDLAITSFVEVTATAAVADGKVLQILIDKATLEGVVAVRAFIGGADIGSQRSLQAKPISDAARRDNAAPADDLTIRLSFDEIKRDPNRTSRVVVERYKSQDPELVYGTLSQEFVVEWAEAGYTATPAQASVDVVSIKGTTKYPTTVSAEFSMSIMPQSPAQVQLLHDFMFNYSGNGQYALSASTVGRRPTKGPLEVVGDPFNSFSPSQKQVILYPNISLMPFEMSPHQVSINAKNATELKFSANPGYYIEEPMLIDLSSLSA